MSVNAETDAVEQNYYEILGVEPTASMDEIEIAWKAASRKYHPDKSRGQTAHIFNKCREAKLVLLSEVSRRDYDISIGLVKDTAEERIKICRAKKAQALRELRSFEDAVANIRAFEAEIDGLIIELAKYGDMTDTDGLIDVTVPLQCMVHESQLLISSNIPKYTLEGFYDPTEGQRPCSLYVRYKFRSVMHEVQVDDRDTLCIPREEHCIDTVLEDPALEQKKKARRRALLYTTVSLALGATTYLMRHRLPILSAAAWWPWKSQTPSSSNSKAQ